MLTVDCRSAVGVTVGLIDAMITLARTLRHRDLTDPHVLEALKDIRSDEDVSFLLQANVGGDHADS